LLWERYLDGKLICGYYKDTLRTPTC